jgi:perosamine synthetase
MDKYQNIISFIRTCYNEPSGFIPLHAPLFIGNEKKYLNECIDSTFVSSVGKFVDTFEVEMTRYTGSRKAVACVNGTSALHLALKLIGVGIGDEVITQPLTFIATANAITYCGAHPIFLDVDLDTLGLSPDALEKWFEENVELRSQSQPQPQPQPYNKVTGRRVSACVPMHTFGHPCRIDEIVKICKRYNIPVVEDAAESLGSFYKGKHTGTFGDIGVLSFNGNKIITTGGGGMLLFQDEEFAKRAKHISTQAKVPHPWDFVHDEIGYKYRMPNINAALGLAQLEQLPEYLKSKRQIANKYNEFFSTLTSTLAFLQEPENALSNYWLNCILFNNKKERDDFLKFSNENKVMTRPVWCLINELEMFKNCQADDLIIAKEIANRLVNIPSSVIN